MFNWTSKKEITSFLVSVLEGKIQTFSIFIDLFFVFFSSLVQKFDWKFHFFFRFFPPLLGEKIFEIFKIFNFLLTRPEIWLKIPFFPTSSLILGKNFQNLSLFFAYTSKNLVKIPFLKKYFSNFWEGKFENFRNCWPFFFFFVHTPKNSIKNCWLFFLTCPKILQKNFIFHFFPLHFGWENTNIFKITGLFPFSLFWLI